MAGVYAGLVLLATRVPAATTQPAVAAATLAAAAPFNPLRRRVQRAVDRRFNRAQYDADRTVAAFAARLQDATDLDAVQADPAASCSTPWSPPTSQYRSGHASEPGFRSAPPPLPPVVRASRPRPGAVGLAAARYPMACATRCAKPCGFCSPIGCPALGTVRYSTPLACRSFSASSSWAVNSLSSPYR